MGFMPNRLSTKLMTHKHGTQPMTLVLERARHSSNLQRTCCVPRHCGVTTWCFALAHAWDAIGLDQPLRWCLSEGIAASPVGLHYRKLPESPHACRRIKVIFGGPILGPEPCSEFNIFCRTLVTKGEGVSKILCDPISAAVAIATEIMWSLDLDALASTEGVCPGLQPC